MTEMRKADICVIGAGSGGLSVAAGAAQLGLDVVLVEKGEMGGDCLNYGCVPSKALIAAAKRAHAFRTSQKFGIAPHEPEIDFAAVNAHIRHVIAAIEPNDSQERFEKLGCTVIRAPARFLDERTIEAGGETIRAKTFVLATGSRPFVPPIPGLDEVEHLTNETLFDLTRLPERLVVVGGGPIGMEMAQAHRRLGAEVTLLEAGAVLAKDDPELSAVVKETLTAEGVDIREGARVTAVAKTGEGLVVHFDGPEGARTVEGSHLLLAVGRRATVAGLDLEKAGIEYSDRGVKVDGRLRTTNKRVFAAGDVAGGMQFTHVAGYHAGIVVRNALFKAPAKNNEDLAPWTTYTDPELAHVGLTEKAAREKHGEGVRIVRWTYEENDRAQAERATTGFIKAVVRKNGQVLGASIVGAQAGELIQPWAIALASKLKIGAFTSYIAPYPTLGEVSKRAGGAYYTPTLFSPMTRRLVRFLSYF